MDEQQQMPTQPAADENLGTEMPQEQPATPADDNQTEQPVADQPAE